MLHDLRAELEKLSAAGPKAELHCASSKTGNLVETKGKEVVSFSNWDFLDIRNNQRLKRGAQICIEEGGISAPSSRFCGGTTRAHLSCERRLAEFFGTESALLFSSKNQVVLSLITSVFSERDLILADELAHSPIADAAFLVGAEVATYRGADLATLEKELEKNRSGRRRFVFIESVSPLSGALVDLNLAQELARMHGANLIVDETFALGSLGLRGAGCSEEWSTFGQAELCCKYGDLSCGLGVFGAALAGPEILISCVLARSRTAATEAPLPPALARSIETAIDLTELQPIMRGKIRLLAERLRRGISKISSRGLADGSSPIIGLSLDRHRQCVELAGALFQRGFLVDVLPQLKPLSEAAVVRFLVNASHTEKQIDELLQALSDLLPRIEVS